MQAGIRDRMSAQRSPTTGVVHVVIAEGIAVRALDDASKSVYFRNPAHGEDVSSIGVIFAAPNRNMVGFQVVSFFMGFSFHPRSRPSYVHRKRRNQITSKTLLLEKHFQNKAQHFLDLQT